MGHYVNPDYIPFSIASASQVTSGINLDGRQLVGGLDCTAHIGHSGSVDS